MVSENLMNNNQILCSNDIGFFGTPSTMNLCSKCYRDHRLKQENESVQKSPSLTPVVDQKLAESSSETTLPFPKQPTPPARAKTGNCCGSCKRKLKITATYTCKCGRAFCAKHIFPGDHNCSFVYKAAGKEVIAKANSIIKCVKIERI